jgi:WD40 repeat protein
MAVLPNGFLAGGCADGKIYVWNTDDMSLNKSLTGHSEGVNALVVLVNGFLASASDDDTILVWDANTQQSFRNLSGHISSVTSLAALANGNLASASADKSIKIWNATDGSLIKSSDSGYNYEVYALAVLQSGLLASGGGLQPDVKIWSVESNSSCITIASTTKNPINSQTQCKVLTLNKTLSGHKGPVFSLLVLANGNYHHYHKK